MSLDDILPEDADDAELLRVMMLLSTPISSFKSKEEKEAFFQGVMRYQCPKDQAYESLKRAAENGCKLAQIYPIQKYQGKQQ